MVGSTNASWISPSFSDTDMFTIDGVSLPSITKTMNSSGFVYSKQTITDQYQKLQNAMKPNNIGIYYSVKANTSLAVLDHLYALGTGLEVASVGELLAVQAIGADPKRVSFAGPVKSKEALEIAIGYGVHTINVETFDEIEMIDQIAREHNKIQQIGLRINPQKEVSGTSVTMGGGSRKFGFDDEIVDADFIKKVTAYPNVLLAGLHVFAASQILSAESFCENVTQICTIAERLHALYDLRYIDFGGGLGIPYDSAESPLPLEEITHKVEETLQSFPFINENSLQLFIEPGRFLVGTSGVYLTTVAAVKSSRGRQIVLVDGGLQHLLRPELIGDNHPVYNLSHYGETKMRTFDIGGALCTSADFLGKNIQLPENTKRGDVIGIFCTGAYGWSEAMPYFLSHPTAAEAFIHDGTISLVRPSVHPREFLRNQQIPGKEKHV